MRQFLIYRLRKMKWAAAAALLLAAFMCFIQPPAPVSVSVPEQNLSAQPGIEKPLWTATKTMTAEQNAIAHFEKHGAEMGFDDAAAYVRAAQQFLRTPPQGTETKIEEDGDILRYNEKLGWFGVMRPDGAPRTLFIPDPDTHGASSNRAYFDRQE